MFEEDLQVRIAAEFVRAILYHKGVEKPVFTMQRHPELGLAAQLKGDAAISHGSAYLTLPQELSQRVSDLTSKLSILDSYARKRVLAQLGSNLKRSILY